MEIDSLINEIYKDKMNSICFDCGVENPVFVSINNGIFLCDQCATVHMSFPQGISIIENNDLYALSENQLKFLSFGGNTRLNDFILDEFPKLENYSQKLLYKTRGMDYYRKRLYYFVNGGLEPKRPSQIVGCQLVPDNYYNQNSYYRQIPKKKVESKTRTYRPEEHVKSRKYNINQRNNENDMEDEDEFFRDPFMNESKFRMNEGDIFKRFFGGNLFDDEDFFNLGGGLNQTQIFNPPSYQEKPKPKQAYEHRNIDGPQDNLYKSTNPTSKNTNPPYQKTAKVRPLTASNPIFVPSRKHKYIKKDQNNNPNNDTYNNNYNNAPEEPKRENKSTINNNYQNINEKDKYNPFNRRDSTDLITLPGNENSSSSKNKKQQKTHEIPLEFHKQASGLGQIADTVNEKDEDSLNEISEKSENESMKSEDSSEELDRIAAQNNSNTYSTNNPKDIYDEDQITFKNSIRNKYKKKKSMQMEEELKKQAEKLKNSKNNNAYESKYSKKKSNEGNINKKSKKKGNEFKTKKSNDESNNLPFDKQYARRLSKMNISSTYWNINQLGDIGTYPDAMEIEE